MEKIKQNRRNMPIKVAVSVAADSNNQPRCVTQKLIPLLILFIEQSAEQFQIDIDEAGSSKLEFLRVQLLKMLQKWAQYLLWDKCEVCSENEHTSVLFYYCQSIRSQAQEISMQLNETGHQGQADDKLQKFRQNYAQRALDSLIKYKTYFQKVIQKCKAQQKQDQVSQEQMPQQQGDIQPSKSPQFITEEQCPNIIFGPQIVSQLKELAKYVVSTGSIFTLQNICVIQQEYQSIKLKMEQLRALLKCKQCHKASWKYVDSGMKKLEVAINNYISQNELTKSQTGIAQISSTTYYFLNIIGHKSTPLFQMDHTDGKQSQRVSSQECPTARKGPILLENMSQMRLKVVQLKPKTKHCELMLIVEQFQQLVDQWQEYLLMQKCEDCHSSLSRYLRELIDYDFNSIRSLACSMTFEGLKRTAILSLIATPFKMIKLTKQCSGAVHTPKTLVSYIL